MTNVKTIASCLLLIGAVRMRSTLAAPQAQRQPGSRDQMDSGARQRRNPKLQPRFA